MWFIFDSFVFDVKGVDDVINLWVFIMCRLLLNLYEIIF